VRKFHGFFADASIASPYRSVSNGRLMLKSEAETRFSES
jgi:hypothetical protein